MVILVLGLLVGEGFEEFGEGLDEASGGFDGLFGGDEEGGEEDDPGEGVAGVDGEVVGELDFGVSGLDRNGVLSHG